MMKKVDTTEICSKMKQHTMYELGKIHKSKCDKPATYFNGDRYFCTKHARKQRYIIRNGDVGEILKRFDSEKKMRDNIDSYPGMRMQKITSGHRKDIY